MRQLRPGPDNARSRRIARRLRRRRRPAPRGSRWWQTFRLIGSQIV